MDSDGAIFVPAGLNKIAAIEQDGPVPPTATPDPNVTNTPIPTATTTPTPQQGARHGFFSEQTWYFGTSADGEIFRDQAHKNNGSAGPIQLAGQTYAKGLSVHTDSTIRFSIDPTCWNSSSTFTATVGVEDSSGNNGTVEFQVMTNNNTVYRSGLVLDQIQVLYISQFLLRT